MNDPMHDCPAPGCERRVPFERFACAPHWYSISRPAQIALLRAWRDHPGDDAYFEARAECLAELGVPDDAIAEANAGVPRKQPPGEAIGSRNVDELERNAPHLLADGGDRDAV